MINQTDRDLLEVFTAFVRLWLRSLAQSDWTGACAMLDEANTHGLRWTPSALQDLIAGTFGPGTRFAAQHPEGPRVCSPEDVATPHPPLELIAYNDGSGYTLDHDFPLNGTWSDLTARFEFLRKPDGFAVVLHDLHVL